MGSLNVRGRNIGTPGKGLRQTKGKSGCRGGCARQERHCQSLGARCWRRPMGALLRPNTALAGAAGARSHRPPGRGRTHLLMRDLRA
eukprot:scaffold2075_cov101-Isochrysis_galbana.AAC.1